MRQFRLKLKALVLALGLPLLLVESGARGGEANFVFVITNFSKSDFMINGPATNYDFVPSAPSYKCQVLPVGHQSVGPFQWGRVGAEALYTIVANGFDCKNSDDNLISIKFSSVLSGNCNGGSANSSWKSQWFNTVGVNTCVAWQFTDNNATYHLGLFVNSDNQTPPAIVLQVVSVP